VTNSLVPKFAKFKKDSFDEPQPFRTVLERLFGADGHIDIAIEE
jgi:hypothetical protein